MSNKISEGKSAVVFVLDKSGSMETVRTSTISGFNEYIQTLKKEAGKYDFSLTLFSTDVEKKYVNVPLYDVEELDVTSYNPMGGTALYDAVCQTIDEVEKKTKKSEKVLLVIMTDGQENSSKEFTQNDLKERITRLQKGNWSFVFMGANQDSWVTAQAFGMKMNNVANYQTTDSGTSAAFMAMAMNTTTFQASSTRSTSNFFCQKDKDDLKNA